MITMPLIVWHFYEWPILGSLFTLLIAPVFKFLFLPGVLFLTLFNRWLPETLLLLIEEGLILFERIIDFSSGSSLIIGRLPLVLSGMYIFGLLICMDRLKEQPVKHLFYVGLFLLFLTLPFYAFLQRSLLSMSVKETVSFAKSFSKRNDFDRYWRSVTL